MGNMEKEEKNEENLDRETRIYELGYLLLPTVLEDKIQDEVSLIRDLIVENQAAVISEDAPKSRTLSYEMSKTISNKIIRFNSAHFGWIKFEAYPATNITIKDKLDKNNNILRFIIVKTVKEDILAKKPIVNKKPLRKPALEKKTKETVSEEEMDKTIEELVIN